MITTSIVSAMVSVKRLSKFLKAGELQEAAVLYEAENMSLPVLEVKSGEFRWTEELVEPSLEGIDLKVNHGELVVILGRVASGKVFSTIDLHTTELMLVLRPVFYRLSREKCTSQKVPWSSGVPWRIVLRIHGSYCILPFALLTFFSGS
jgi:ABC-type transport system involved in cytochrome bd biosynthesis fused ATPase/permease subunit